MKFNASLTGADVPDVVVLSDVWWFHFALNGTIAPLDDLFGQVGVDPSDYVDTLLADYEFNGQHYALPYARSTPLFYYSKPVWERVGLPDRGPHSWQEFDEWGPQLQRVVGDRKWAHGWANANSGLSWTFEAPDWAFGGGYSKKWNLTFTDPATIAAGTFLRDSIYTKGYAAVGNDVINEFATGILASTVTSTGFLAGIAETASFDFGVSALPTGPGGAPGCPTGGAGLAIPTKLSEERKLNALKFIAFVTNPTQTAYFSQSTGYLLVRKSALDDPSEKKYLADNPRAQVAINQLQHIRSQDYAAFSAWRRKHYRRRAGIHRVGRSRRDHNFTQINQQLQVILDRQIMPKLPS